MSEDPYQNYPQPGHMPVHGGVSQQQQQGLPQGTQMPQGMQAPQGTQMPPPNYPPGAPSMADMGLSAADIEAFAAVKQELDARGGDGADYWKPKQPQSMGDSAQSYTRILPAWPGKEQTIQPGGMFWREYCHFIWVPSQESPGKNVRQAVLCGRKMTPEGHQPIPCAVCDRRDQAEREGDQKTADSLEAKPRFLFNVIDLEDPGSHWKRDAQGQQLCVAKVATFGPGLMKKLINLFHQRRNIADLQTGRNLVITTYKVGKSQRDVRYDVLDTGDACPVPQGMERIRLLDLSQVTPRRDYQELVAQMQQTYAARPQQPMGYQSYQASPGPQSAPYGNPYPPQQPVVVGTPPYANPYQPQQAAPPMGMGGAPPQRQQPPVAQQQPAQPQQPAEPFPQGGGDFGGPQGGSGGPGGSPGDPPF